MKTIGFSTVFLSAVILASISTFLPVSAANMGDVSTSGNSSMTTTSTAGENTTKVEVGGGNMTVQYYRFSPQTVEIDPGQGVTWYSPSLGFGEFHTVTFVMDKSLNSDVIIPFGVQNSTDFKVLPPFNVGKPLAFQTPNGTTAVMAANKVVFTPTVLGNDTNSPNYLNGTDIHVTLNGTEKAINSGIIEPQSAFEMFAGGPGSNATSASSSQAMPDLNATASNNGTMTSSAGQEGQQPGGEQMGPPIPFVNKFTVTFKEPGTYDYFCAFHPWMSGQVIVRGEPGSNQTTSSVMAP